MECSRCQGGWALVCSPRLLFPQAYEKQRGARREEQKELQRAAAQDQVRGFLEKEAAIVSRPLNPFMPKAATLPNTGDKEYLPLVGSFGGSFLRCVPLPQMVNSQGPVWVP